jgi:hypothetical protein
MKIYCLYDEVAEEAGPLFEARNDNMARRIRENLDMSQLPAGSHISDYRLFKLGFFNRGDSQARPFITALDLPMDITAHQDVTEVADEPL